MGKHLGNNPKKRWEKYKKIVFNKKIWNYICACETYFNWI